MRREVPIGRAAVSRVAREVWERWGLRGGLQEAGRQPCGTWRWNVPGESPGSRVRTGEAVSRSRQAREESCR